ncbi:MAG: site-2 protease family protein [Vicinamibacterales bacterium]
MSLEFILPVFAVLILSLSFHEAAHAWAADRLGDPTARQLGRLTMNPIKHIDPIGTVLFPLIAITTGFPVIGWARPVPVNLRNLKAPRRDYALVALAGPVSNLVLAAAAGLALAASDVTPLPGGSWLPGSLLNWMLVLNVLLAVFNMIPVPPLDGGNVLAGIAPEPVARLIDAIRPYGFILLYVLLLTGMLDVVFGPVQNWVLSWFR